MAGRTAIINLDSDNKNARKTNQVTDATYEINELARICAEITCGIKGAIPDPSDFAWARKTREALERELND